MGDWNPGEEDRERRKHRRQVQWGTQVLLNQGDFAPRRLVSLETEDPNAPLQGWQITCSRNILNPLGLAQPVYHIQAGVGGLIWDWRLLAPGTYILYAQSVKVYVIGDPGGAVSAQAWAGRTEAAPTLVLP